MKLLPLLLLLSGCFNWVQTDDVKSVKTTYVETDQAPMISAAGYWAALIQGAPSGCGTRQQTNGVVR